MAASELPDVRTVRKALRETRGKQKLEMLLSGDEPGRLVRSLPPEELYLAILDVGPDDAAEVVALASPEQFRHFVDMAAWRGGDEGPRVGEVLHWLRLSRDGAGGAKHLRFRGQLSGLDVELLALVLRRSMTVHDLGEDQHPNPKNPALAFYTPSGGFVPSPALGTIASVPGVKALTPETYLSEFGYISGDSTNVRVLH